MANLSERRSSLTGELSVGWKQRLALGCAIIHEPEILFLDEPTSGVDPVSRRAFWDLIYDVAGKGVTVFVTTHNMDEAEHCDRIAMIYRGRRIALGSPGELKANAFRGALLEVHASPLMDALDRLAEEPAMRDAAIFGAALHVTADDPSAAETIRETLKRGGVAVERIEPIPPTLEDVFVALVEQTDREAEVGQMDRPSAEKVR
jgi:ABC-2 type transport system ATP-binding protein